MKQDAEHTAKIAEKRTKSVVDFGLMVLYIETFITASRKNSWLMDFVR
jgi:hypothetical protein